MAIPNISKEGILQALAYIDEHGVPDKFQGKKYEIVTEKGGKYPLKYVIAIADHLENGVDISIDGFDATKARDFLTKKGFSIAMKKEKFELTITAEKIISTDSRFDINNIALGDIYEPIEAYFKSADGSIIYRKYNKGERKKTNQTLPRIAFQIFEKQIADLTEIEKEAFPVCKYNPQSDWICGIYNSIEDFKKHRRTIEYLRYFRNDGGLFVIYCWNIFSTLFFVQECLKQFGVEGDEFVLEYQEKNKKIKKDSTESITDVSDELITDEENESAYQTFYAKQVINSKNIIFRGAPGTGKSYLAKQIAADIISGGDHAEYEKLSLDEKKQVEFVQFHPSYDYSDFVEGLRPVDNGNNNIGFELKDGIFKDFVNRARENFENSTSDSMVIKKFQTTDAIDSFLDNAISSGTTFTTKKGHKFIIGDFNDSYIKIVIPDNLIANQVTLNRTKLQKLLEADENFDNVKKIQKALGKNGASQSASYFFVLYEEIRKLIGKVTMPTYVKEEEKPFVFIIDEINRGEISKIFGELFYSIEPSKRGKAGEIATQYANLHDDYEEKFYIPENVYIIGTMNDIDRSVDSFDFAMRRRFRFVEIKANENIEMLNNIKNDEVRTKAINRMINLNNAIENIEDLNTNYQIGAAYFLKINEVSFEELWSDYLEPLLQEYVNGMHNFEIYMKTLKEAYDNEAESVIIEEGNDTGDAGNDEG